MSLASLSNFEGWLVPLTIAGKQISSVLLSSKLSELELGANIKIDDKDKTIEVTVEQHKSTTANIDTTGSKSTTDIIN